MIRSSLFLIFIALLPLKASAQLSLTENFLNLNHLDPASTTLVWNTYFHTLHPPLAISFTTAVNAEDSLNASVGSGRDGAFDVSTYSSFSVGGSTAGNVITIDTNAHPTLQFTYFNLASGWRLKGIGSNPLWIQVLGTVTIAGTIDCNGENGADSDTVTTSPTIGGIGRCSGGNGGNGGYNGTAATQGLPLVGPPTGGLGGTLTGGSGGGGGGGYRAIVGQPQAGSGAGAGGAGSETTDNRFTTFAGGAGGGGGAYNNAGPGYRGASGGGGGGVIRITSVGDITVTATGQVLAKGGTGGGGVAPAGGGGGGGGGGGIWFQTPGTITNNGFIDAGVFSGAPDFTNEGVVAGGNNGGRGSDGRTWLTNSTMFITPAGSENPVTDLIDPGVTHFSLAVGYSAQSYSYDAHNTYPTYTSFNMSTTLPGTSTATMLIAGSSDNFINDTTGFIATTNLAPLAGKRFFKFRIALQEIPAGFASTAATVNSVTANYSGVTQTDFNFSQSCGLIGGPKEGLFFLSLFALLYFITSGRLGKSSLWLIPKKIRQS